MIEEEILAQLRAGFREEALENIEAIHGHLQALNANPEDARRERGGAAMRLAHNIKGAAASVGEEDVSRLAHALEDVLELIRDAKEPPSPPMLTATADALALIRRCLDEPDAVSGATAAAEQLRLLAGT